MVSSKIAAGIIAAILILASVIGLVALRPGSSPASETSTGGGFSSSTTSKVSISTASSSTQTRSTSTTASGGNTSTGGTASFQKGVTFSPAAFNSSSIAAFLSKASQAGKILEWAGDWMELGPGGAPATISQLASQNGLKTMVVVQFFQQSNGALLRPLNMTNEQTYLNLTKNFVEQYRPAYFGVGIEVNILYEKNSTAFQEFISLYGRVYNLVKSASPGTAVFTVFQLERMNGLKGGLYGGTNNTNDTEWQLLSLFKTDVAAFTTYPGLIYQDPSEIPTDYYTRVSQHVNQSVGFTEVGWHSGNMSGGWGSSEQEQSSFVSTFFTLSRDLDKAFVVWSFLYDQSAAPPFGTMGLFYVNGTAKIAWQTWLLEP